MARPDLKNQALATKVPFDTGPIHFVGIGGIGMSGIAEVLLNLGYQVQGSDMRESANTERLLKLGAKIFIGQKEGQVDGAGAIVLSSAIKADNPELVEARSKSIPVVRRAEMLAELMRLKWTIAVGGTHGKTTTTTMIAALLEGGDIDPTVINGGIINAYGSNAKLGLGDWMVVEADESDGSFLKLLPTVAIVTNIDPEHMEHYGEFDVLRAAFHSFVETLPFYGFSVLCIDHPEVQALVSKVTDRRVITYGFNPQADVRAENLELEPTGSRFDVVFSDEESWKGLFLPMAGKHNTQNMLSAIAVSRELGLSEAQVRKGLESFGGVKRRFTKVGEWNGVTIIDDYGHHPVEISAVLQAARQVAKGKVHAVVQPHRYSRLSHHFEEFSTCFNDADNVYVADVYAAGEEPLEGISGPSLAKSLMSHGHKNVELTSKQTLAKDLKPNLEEGDLIVCLGAGDITYWAADLANNLGVA
ncbi:UDP-N-acetylmuramate--L-alanine ligase [Litorimonas taeanensis]|uniref:UDP-N-acetylmuramate--L-alanine ligase n=1 Tax=Litorimonas taeanensis TaxID=568099 RepID=A0A420WLC5_9PROT|nr:UDP-N-acetylmuramate--L-alanine ligase [Litorimonas taeanensis]RKQ71712.1 UDP-N-acetylmuramate--L-alanine ligase [Litorimonas taeanensis]